MKNDAEAQVRRCERREFETRTRTVIINIERRRSKDFAPRKTVLKEREMRRDNKYRGRQENKDRGISLEVRRMQRSVDSREIKIEAEARIMHKRAALTRSTMQNQDKDLTK